MFLKLKKFRFPSGVPFWRNPNKSGFNLDYQEIAKNLIKGTSGQFFFDIGVSRRFNHSDLKTEINTVKCSTTLFLRNMIFYFLDDLVTVTPVFLCFVCGEFTQCYLKLPFTSPKFLKYDLTAALRVARVILLQKWKKRNWLPLFARLGGNSI